MFSRRTLRSGATTVFVHTESGWLILHGISMRKEFGIPFVHASQGEPNVAMPGMMAATFSAARRSIMDKVMCTARGSVVVGSVTPSPQVGADGALVRKALLESQLFTEAVPSALGIPPPQAGSLRSTVSYLNSNLTTSSAMGSFPWLLITGFVNHIVESGGK